MTVQPHVALCRLQPSRDYVEQHRAFRSCTTEKIITPEKLNQNLRLTGRRHDADHVAASGFQIDGFQHAARALIVVHVSQLEIG